MLRNPALALRVLKSSTRPVKVGYCRRLATGRTPSADFRSDTFTKPTPDVLQAMCNAEVGDDGWGEDPTVIALESHVSNLVGHEAAIFVASGCMGNQVALRSWLPAPPHTVIMHRKSHIFEWEAGAIGALSQTIPITIPSQTLEAIQEAYIPYNEPDIHFAGTRVIALENTIYGEVIPYDEMERVSKWVRGLRSGKRPTVPASTPVLHLDGARLWNASVKSGVPVRKYGELVDSTNLCLSKGLGAPVGSIVTGPAEMIAKARQVRKMLGGGWRQAGILAAAALHVVRHHFPQQLAIDHDNAAYLAASLKRIGVDVVKPVQTNMVFADFSKLLAGYCPKDVERILDQEYGVKLFCWNFKSVRLVTHLQVDRAAVDRLVQALKDLAYRKGST